MEKSWKCPVCSFEAVDENELDNHIQQTGHVIFDDTEDKGKETPKEPDDLSYSKHSGYTPGISSGDVMDQKSDLESKERAQKKDKEEENS